MSGTLLKIHILTALCTNATTIVPKICTETRLAIKHPDKRMKVTHQGKSREVGS